MNPDATHRRALVTGAGRGLGRAIAERLARDGFHVGLLARSADELESTARAIRDEGGTAQPLVADVRDPAAMRAALDRFAPGDTPLHCLTCAAATLAAIGPLEAVEPDAWWQDVETPLRGAYNAIRAALPALRRAEGSSVSMLVGPGYNGELAFASGYATAQAALVRLAETLAAELRDTQVRVHAVYPGLVPTGIVRHAIDSPEGRRWLPRFNEAFAEGKEVGPEAVAEMVAWLTTRRPAALHGRAVAAPLPPEILETRLDRIERDDLGRLRMR